MRILDTQYRQGSRTRRLSICRLSWVFIVEAFLLLVPLFAHARIMEFDLKPLWSAEFEKVQPVDIDGDGFDELLMSRKGKDPPRWGISLTDVNATAKWQYWSSNRTLTLGTADILGDEEAEILAWEKIENQAFLLIFSSSSQLLKRFKVAEGQDLDPPSGWDGGLGFKGVIDVGGDGKKELLISVASYFDIQPRGFMAIDPETGRRLWFYRVGFAPGSVEIADLDGDGLQEVILGSFSVNNGSQANETDDQHTYVTVLNNRGELLWRKEIGGHFSGTRVRIADFNKDGIKEIVVMEETVRVDYLGPDKLMILDGPTGETKKIISTGEAYRKIELLDINRDAMPEIITGNTDGVVRAFDANLEEVAWFEYPGEIELTGAGDLNGDGHPEILVTTLDGKLLILDDKLQEIQRLESHEGYRFYTQLVNWGRRKRILLYAVEPNGRIKYTMMEVKRKLAEPGKLSMGIIIPLGALVLGLLLVVLFLLYKSKNLIRGVAGDPSRGVIFLTSTGKVKVLNTRARHLLNIDDSYNLRGRFCDLKLSLYSVQIRDGICELIDDPVKHSKMIKVSREGRERWIRLNVRRLKLIGWLVTFYDVTESEFGKRVSTWVPVAQQLAHGIKNPLSHIRLAIQRLEKLILEGKDKKDEAHRYSMVVSDEVDRLLNLTDGFMKFTKLEPPKRKLIQVRELINDLVQRVASTLPGGVKIKTEFDDGLLPVMLDPDQISIVLDHLLDNAITAVGNKGKISIKLSLFEKVDSAGHLVPSIEIRISDTGPGIPPEYLNKIFDPYFSLREGGTGLGLAIARKIIEEHKGSIKVDSAEGLGTTFILTLPRGDDYDET